MTGEKRRDENRRGKGATESQSRRDARKRGIRTLYAFSLHPHLLHFLLPRRDSRGERILSSLNFACSLLGRLELD
jgi:hypothetical protein